MARMVILLAIYLCVTVLVVFDLGVEASVEEFCKENEFQCFDGECVKDSYACDQKPDCSDGSDETADACINVICNKDGYFKCDRSCVPNEWFCDGEPDCDDGADEPKGCEKF